MSTMARPRGPLPARVYWFRRLALVAVVLAMVFGVAQLLGLRSGADAENETARTVAGRPSGGGPASQLPTDDAPPAEQSTAPSPDAGTAGTTGPREDEPSRTPLPEPSGPCEDADVLVEPRLKSEAHAGSPVLFRFKIKAAETPACTWEIAPDSVVLSVTSGDDRVWSSQDCEERVPTSEVTVRKQGRTGDFDLVWKGRRSDSDCSSQAGWALPGWYHVTAAAYGGEPTDLQFELEDPVRPTVTKPATPRAEETPTTAEREGARERPDREDR